MKKLQLTVEGMHCKSCGMVIEDNLKEVGVDKVSVSPDDKKVSVEFDEKKVDLRKIKQAIEKEGYKVK